MTFDNGKTIIRLKLRVLAATVIYFLYLLIALFAKVITFPLAGMDKIALTLLVSGIYAIVSFYPILLRYNYIYFSNDGDAVIVRYYSVGMFTQKKSSVEIAKQTYAGFETGKTLFGSNSYIILKQRMREGIAKYPPIYITSLSKAEKERLLEGLSAGM